MIEVTLCLTLSSLRQGFEGWCWACTPYSQGDYGPTKLGFHLEFALGQTTQTTSRQAFQDALEGEGTCNRLATGRVKSRLNDQVRAKRCVCTQFNWDEFSVPAAT